ncbi:MAG: Hpt domain protein [Idiomarinaceae bacterium HL-53]|nr:MAG: Hpt domain protein [Idiomarinaceae bacterium HL-53]CUS47303.1 HPt (histidine-containing phosphotransfer) domain-containing protein [Idiomarinaceae bacterium HL-53]
MSHIDTQLLQQYIDMLGLAGIEESVRAFHNVIPDYMEALETNLLAKDSGGFRKQAHKIKGACRSIGFKRLATEMEYFEKAPWSWPEVTQKVASWDSKYQEDRALLDTWLQQAGNG